MRTSEQNIELAINLADHLGEKVESIRFETIRENENGAALYAVSCWSGEIRYVIEGETGELLGNWEDQTEALENWNL